MGYLARPGTGRRALPAPSATAQRSRLPARATQHHHPASVGSARRQRAATARLSLYGGAAMAKGSLASWRKGTARRTTRQLRTDALLLFIWIQLLPACAGATEKRASSPHGRIANSPYASPPQACIRSNPPFAPRGRGSLNPLTVAPPFPSSQGGSPYHAGRQPMELARWRRQV